MPSGLLGFETVPARFRNDEAVGRAVGHEVYEPDAAHLASERGALNDGDGLIVIGVVRCAAEFEAECIAIDFGRSEFGGLDLFAGRGVEESELNGYLLAVELIGAFQRDAGGGDVGRFGRHLGRGRKIDLEPAGLAGEELFFDLGDGLVIVFAVGDIGNFQQERLVPDRFGGHDLGGKQSGLCRGVAKAYRHGFRAFVAEAAFESHLGFIDGGRTGLDGCNRCRVGIFRLIVFAGAAERHGCENKQFIQIFHGLTGCL